MVMNSRLMRPKNKVVYHPEALDWQSRVIANSGAVSSTTLKSISIFCTSIDAAGLRSKLGRLNLFAGSNLAAALTPLYRSASYGGTAYGPVYDPIGTVGTTPFVSGDYVESAGLTGNNAKYLSLGDPQSLLASGWWATSHIAIDTIGGNLANTYWIGCFFNGTPTGAYADWGTLNIYPRIAGNFTAFNGKTYGDVPSVVANDGNLKIACRFSTSALEVTNCKTPFFTAAISNPSGTSTILPPSFPVFTNSYQNVTAGVPSSVSYNYAACASTFRGYSLGLGMTLAQVASFNTIWKTFRTALGRP